MRSTGFQFIVHDACSAVRMQSLELGQTRFAVGGDEAKAELLIEYVQRLFAHGFTLRKDAYQIGLGKISE